MRSLVGAIGVSVRYGTGHNEKCSYQRSRYKKKSKQRILEVSE